METQGVANLLKQIQDEWTERTYVPLQPRRREIPKEGGKVRLLSIPAIRDRVAQGALKLINPILRERVNHSAIGNSSRYFRFIRDWMEKKSRRHLMKTRKRRDFGRERRSTSCVLREARLECGVRPGKQVRVLTIGLTPSVLTPSVLSNAMLLCVVTIDPIILVSATGILRPHPTHA